MSITRKVNLEYPETSIIAHAAEIIRSGGVIVYPTETLYGIGVDARNRAAILKVYKLKKRREGKPLLVIVDSRSSLESLVGAVSDIADKLMQKFWPGPLTLLFDASSSVLSDLTQGTGKIGVRIPSSKLCLLLLKECGFPITSTSANVSGHPSLRTISEIEKALDSDVDVYLDAGELPVSEASTVIDVSGRIPGVVREGAISVARIKQVIPNISL